MVQLPAALADQLVADPEAVPAGPLGVDRVGERAVEQVGIDRQAELGELARAGVLVEPARSASALRRLPRSCSRPPTSAGSGLAPAASSARVRASVSIAKASPFSSPPGLDLGDLGVPAVGADAPGAEVLELEPVAEARGQGRRGRRAATAASAGRRARARPRPFAAAPRSRSPRSRRLRCWPSESPPRLTPLGDDAARTDAAIWPASQFWAAPCHARPTGELIDCAPPCLAPRPPTRRTRTTSTPSTG